MRGETSKVRVELRRTPLVPAAGALIAGIVGGRFLPLPGGLWAVLAVAGAVVAAVGLWRPGLHGLAVGGVLVAVAGLGAVAVGLDYFAAGSDDVLTYTGPHHILATVRGQIVSTPSVSEDDPPPAYGYRRPPQTHFALQARQLRQADGWLAVRGRVAVTIHQADDRLAAGQQVEVMGWLGRVRGPDNPGQYDWSAAARARGMPVRLVAPGVESVSILDGAAHSWLARAWWRVRAAARDHLAACGDEQSGQLVSALIIGERPPSLRALNRAMMRAGVVHYMSISGTHLAIFLGFVYLLCRVLAMSPRRSAIGVLVVLAAYMVLAEARAPLVRSAIMAAALCLAVLTGRSHAALNALAGAAILILAVDPMDLFDPGFQLSFGMVGAILVFRGPARQAIFGRSLRERGLMVFRDEERLRRWLNYTAANWLMDAVVMVLIAYVVSAPLVAYHFHLFSPYAAPLSLLLAPLVTAVLVPGYVSMALAWPMPNLAYAFGQVAGQAAEGLAWSVEAMDRLPGLCLELRDVSIGWVVLCYVAVAAVLATRRMRLGRVLAAAAVGVLAVATAYTQRTSPPSGQAELNVLAVGSGQCVVLRTPSGATVLFDAGTRSGFDAYSQVLGPFLRDQRLPGPSIAFISHPNTDHFNALPEFLRHHRLRRVHVNEWFGAPAAGGLEASSHDSHMLGALRAAGVQVERLAAGQRVALDGRTSVEVLWPPAGREGLSANESSLVLRITCDGVSVLLPADIETLGRQALAAGGGVRADILMLPHHGSWRPSLEEFVQAVSPKVVRASTARDPFGPPAQEEPAEFFARLHRGYRFYSTPRNGWIQVRFGGGAMEVRTMH
ncbi:MAG: ComEC/Rec2 family competence protein [Phycisphaerae bacterium]|nr:ComEC/Rec2 family competence protein [Phycisphaerae bacterium]